MVEGHRPVTHNDVFLEGVSLPAEVVVFHAPPAVELLHMLQRGNAAMDEYQVLRLQNGGQLGQPLPHLGKGRAQRLAQTGKVGGITVIACLPGHLKNAALRVLREVAGEKALVQGVRLKEIEHQAVAVSTQGVDGVGFTQLHNVAQKAQTVRPFFQHVSHQDQNVVRGEGDLL